MEKWKNIYQRITAGFWYEWFFFSQSDRLSCFAALHKFLPSAALRWGGPDSPGPSPIGLGVDNAHVRINRHLREK